MLLDPLSHKRTVVSGLNTARYNSVASSGRKPAIPFTVTLLFREREAVFALQAFMLSLELLLFILSVQMDGDKLSYSITTCWRCKKHT